MKIGIITQPLQNNYGGLLQNWALQQILIKNGHDPVTIDWVAKKTPFWYMLMSRFKYYILRSLGLSKVRLIYRPTKKESTIISQNTIKFVNDNIIRTKIVNSSKGFLEEVQKNKIGGLVVGSDQVWRPRYCKGHLLNMYLDFANHLSLKRVSYAASFGVDSWEYTKMETQACSDLVKKFNLVTVREDSGADLCKKYLDVNASVVLDPTMLLNADDYIRLVNDNQTLKSNGNLFYYILDRTDSKCTLIKSIANNYHMEPFTVMPQHSSSRLMKNDVRYDMANCIYPPVFQWIRAFVDADMVVCDSFHGCVFSIIFNKPFWVLANDGRGNTRFNSLLKTFGLENRMIVSMRDVDSNTFIDWQKVNTIRNKMREKSVGLLLKGLG